MRISPPEIHDRVSNAIARLQDDEGAFRRFIDKHRLDRLEFWLVTRFRYFPGSATPQDFLTFGPYTSVSKYQSALDALVEKKMAERAGEGRYRLVESARKALTDGYNDFFSRVGRPTGLPDDAGEALLDWVDRVYTAAQRQSEVPTPILKAAHSVLPETDAVWVQIERRLVGLSIYREESHIAAWREAGYTGPRIELSTQLFQSKNGLTYDALRAKADRLDDKDFVSALSALHAAGEVVQREERYRLSLSGRAAREDIEAVTDRHYARPFAALQDDEFERMIQALEKLAHK
ncbi:MAG TPA: hypothetical protein VIK33_03050 [Anaerolineae bacterium]